MSSQDVLVLAEVQGDTVADITLELVGAARGIVASTGGQVLVLVPRPDAERFTASLAAADRIVLVNDALLSGYSPEPYLAVLQDVVSAEQPRAVLIGATSIGWDLAPLLAGRLQAPMLTGCQAIRVESDSLVVTTSFCAGKMIAEVEISRSPAILMVLPGAMRPSGENGAAQVEMHTPTTPLKAGSIRFEEFIMPESGDVDITQQDILIAIGRGIQQQDNVEMAEELAEALGGAVCASRPVVDQGWLSPTRQVGKSGMTVKPKLYLALGISGAPEHLEGMKGSDLVIAVNTDPKAPIFDAAHYGADVDVLDLLPALVEAVSAKKG